MGKRGLPCRRGRGCAGGSVLQAGLSPEDLLLLHIRFDSVPIGDGSQAPLTVLTADLALPCFFSLPLRRLGWKGVARRPVKCLPSPLAWQRCEHTHIYTLQYFAAAFGQTTAISLPRPYLWLSQPLPLAQHCCSAATLPFVGKEALPCGRGIEGRSRAEMLSGAEQALGWDPA